MTNAGRTDDAWAEPRYSPRHRNLYIGCGEIIALKQEGFACGLRQRIGEAMAEVSRIIAADLPHRRVTRHDQHMGLSHGHPPDQQSPTALPRSPGPSAARLAKRSRRTSLTTWVMLSPVAREIACASRYASGSLTLRFMTLPFFT